MAMLMPRSELVFTFDFFLIAPDLIIIGLLNVFYLGLFMTSFNCTNLKHLHNFTFRPNLSITSFNYLVSDFVVLII